MRLSSPLAPPGSGCNADHMMEEGRMQLYLMQHQSALCSVANLAERLRAA